MTAGIQDAEQRRISCRSSDERTERGLAITQSHTFISAGNGMTTCNIIGPDITIRRYSGSSVKTRSAWKAESTFTSMSIAIPSI